MKRSITVPGAGRVVVEPDVASVRLGVNIIRESAGAARESAAVTMKQILDAVLATGAARRDVRTALVSLNPVMDYSGKDGPRVTGYQVANTLALTVRDLDKTGLLIDAALAAGASTLDSLEFRLDDASDAQHQARTAAMDDARDRASTIAKSAGAELGGVISVAEGERFSGPVPMPAARAMAMKDASADTPVESGTQEITVALTVTFEFGGKR
jgi:uncharacterized protein